MDLKTQCELSFYQDISQMSDNVWLVKNTLDDRLYVKKLHRRYDYSLYAGLLGQVHPNLATIWAAYETPDGLVTIEQYINGTTLEVLVSTEGPLAEKRAVAIVDQVATALQFLHGYRPPIIHRDVKLSNVILTDEGVAKLIDFNAGRLYSAGASKDTELLGTSGYAAPEQYGFMQTDVRTDIYALGVLFSKLLNGLQEGAQNYNGPLNRVIEKATSFSPDKRYRDISEFRAHVNRQSHPQPAGGAKASAKRFLPPGFRSGTRWKMLLASIGYAFMVLVLFAMDFSNDPLNSPAYAFWGRFIVGAYMLGLVLIWSNYLHVWRFFPLLQGDSRIKTAIGILLATLLFTVALFIMLGIYLVAFGYI